MNSIVISRSIHISSLKIFSAKQTMSHYSAVILGATGGVGGNVLKTLLQSKRCTSIVSLGRREVSGLEGLDPDNKLKQVIVKDLDTLDSSKEYEALIQGCNTAFCTLGAGQPSTLTKSEFEKIDIDYATKFAKVCKDAGVSHITLLTSYGANASSFFHYGRVKGIVEQNYVDMDFDRVSLFRPSLIQTKEARFGFKDKIVQAVLPTVLKVFGPDLHAFPIEQIGQSMVWNAEAEGAGVECVHVTDMARIVEEKVASDSK
ncbi:hypothetical protein K7432_014970 [Basidiobolus ranarum]|uniref:NAD(P)-binding domain-containing protein n=1 Tax=Basidiobolus ranarum TaxID=34480 RepID=A0ABR2WGU5_9FUNG